MALISSSLRNFVFVLAISSLMLGIAGASIVRRIEEQRQFDLPGLSHKTVAGAVDHGHKEVEAWRETIAPGGHMPIHRHELEEIFIILKGGGTVYVAPGPGQSENNFPGEPEATPFSSNSTISIPWNSAHQVVNTNDEDLHIFVVISRPPMISYFYKTWNTPHDDAFKADIPWDKPEGATSTHDEL